MGTVIDQLHVTHGTWRTRHSALQLAVTAAKGCLVNAQTSPHDLDLLINAGIFRDRNLGEPALAAIIQADIGPNPEDPHSDAHGTFSFDIANGVCGILTALQIADGFLRSQTISRALVVASDADPGRAASEPFPFSSAGAALLGRWSGQDDGLGPVSWVENPDDGASFRATIDFDEFRDVLRFRESPALPAALAAAAERAVLRCLDDASVNLSDVAGIIAAPPGGHFRAELAARLGITPDQIAVCDDERMHTAALVAAMERETVRFSVGTHLLLVAAGAGIVAGAALYRDPAL
ncbi:3-oxoacyl-ACP synthase [Mycobacterium sp.]|uniref:3-oxoacyl-ACP synthase n=1 Tax=Mycobacterium sp. TaxID=1785 RepID=UPI0031D7F5F3